MAQLVASFTDLVLSSQQAVKRPPVAQIGPLVEQGRIDLPRRAVGKSGAVEDRPYGFLLRVGERPRRAGAWSRCWRWPVGPVVAAAWHVQQPTGRGNPDLRRQVSHGRDQAGSSLGGSGSVMPNSVASFFCTSIITSAWASLA